MENIEYEFEGNPECPMCGALAGVTSNLPIPTPHPNCVCPTKHKCNNRFAFTGGARRYGPRGSCFYFDAEITVTCWDGTEIGESTSIDMGCAGAGGETDWDVMMDERGEKAASIADGCPDCNPPIVS